MPNHDSVDNNAHHIAQEIHSFFWEGNVEAPHGVVAQVELKAQLDQALHVWKGLKSLVAETEGVAARLLMPAVVSSDALLVRPYTLRRPTFVISSKGFLKLFIRVPPFLLLLAPSTNKSGTE